MTRPSLRTLLLITAALALGCGDRPTAPSASVQPTFSPGNGGAKSGFGFNGSASGFPTGAVTLTGGGAYDPATASNTVPTETSVHSGRGVGAVGRRIRLPGPRVAGTSERLRGG